MPVAPCEPWIVADELGGCCDLPDGADPAHIETAVEAATFLLWARSGRRYGPCPIEVRPSRGRCVPVCRCPCNCGGPCEVRLFCDGLYIGGIVQVVVDGATLDPSSYVLAHPGRLLRADGNCWPACPDLTADGDLFTVTVEAGLPLDAAAQSAAETLACELVKACTPGCDCRLPSNVVTVARQGTTVNLGSLVDLFDAGKVGLTEVDLWLSTVNPQGRLLAPAAVWSPDLGSRPVKVEPGPS